MVAEKNKLSKKKVEAGYSKEMYLQWYELMLRIRRFEERALVAYGQQKIRGFCHVYIGQEAIAAGMEAALQEGDCIATAYRQHGTAIGRGIPTKEAMAELYGKATGIVKGKGGSMHFFQAKNAILVAMASWALKFRLVRVLHLQRNIKARVICV